MKKLFLIIAFLFIIIGCELDKPRCWSCTQVNTYAMPGYLPDTTVTKTIRCDITHEDILEYMHQNTYDGQECYNGYIIQITSSCHCMEATCWEE